ncbi:MAG: hypothetical protein B6I20_12810 [Bacteroidetes bacterium 4572_117]|nr:MAG: hypothetical protein B6I20_12810 [Bacteroidetes bacterium 4572_117]
MLGGINQSNLEERDIRRFGINPVTLAFKGEESVLEQHFLQEYAIKSLNQIRFALFSVLIIYSLFGILDVALIPDFKNKYWTIRSIIVIPSLLILLIMSFLDFFKQFMQLMSAILVVASAFVVLGMMWLAPTDFSNYYFPGVVLVVIMNYGFLQQRFIWASFAGIVVVSSYVILSFGLFSTPFLLNMVNSFFLIFINIVGMFIAYKLELNSRKEYHSKQLLQLERAKLILIIKFV